MEKQFLQIESLGAAELLNRLERIECAILSNGNSPQTAKEANKPNLMTRREVADFLRVSLVTINDWVRKGVLKAYKVGNRVYFKASEIESSMILKESVYANR